MRGCSSIRSCRASGTPRNAARASRRRSRYSASARNQKSRREQVEETLKDIESKQKNAKLTLRQRIDQAGLTWSKRQYFLISAGLGIFAFAMIFFTGFGLLAALGFGFAAGFGLPFWMLGYLKKRREKRFLDAFPDAVDVIVRGIKAGLPLLDSLKMIAAEGQEPVRSEFKAILETQAIGLPLGEACQRLYREHAAAGGELLRHRDLDPEQGRRQSFGSARQPVEGAARPQEDESQDPGHVDGSEGLRRASSVRCRPR